LDRDEAAAGAPGEEVKLDEPAALDEKQQGETATATAAAAAMEQAPPEASAAPEPPARIGGPFSSTVIPRTVDAIADCNCATSSSREFVSVVSALDAVL
jgi:hypothetical protein